MTHTKQQEGEELKTLDAILSDHTTIQQAKDIKEFFKSSLTRAKIDAVEEVEKEIKSMKVETGICPEAEELLINKKSMTRFITYSMNSGYNQGLSNALELLNTYKSNLQDK